jgi:hypothetical protein
LKKRPATKRRNDRKNTQQPPKQNSFFGDSRRTADQNGFLKNKKNKKNKKTAGGCTHPPAVAAPIGCSVSA